MTPLSATSAILTDAPATGKLKLLDRVRGHLRVKHYSIRTEASYVDWIRRFIPVVSSLFSIKVAHGADSTERRRGRKGKRRRAAPRYRLSLLSYWGA